MHYDPMDLSECKWEWQTTEQELAKKWQPYITKMNERKEEWKNSVEDIPELYDFLKQNVHT
jgi:oligoribonuclease (3'-5' exoribonuclease)